MKSEDDFVDPKKADMAAQTDLELSTISSLDQSTMTSIETDSPLFGDSDGEKNITQQKQIVEEDIQVNY